MKLLHTSDWHLGRVLHDRSLLEDQRAFLRQVEDVLRTDPHDALIVAGDVFDRSIPPEDAVDLFASFLSGLRRVAPTMPIVVIAGNHDSGSRLAYLGPLLTAVHVHLRGDPSSLEQPILVRGADGDEAEIFCIPFLFPGALSTHAEGEELPLATQESALEEAMRRVRSARQHGRHHVAVAHCFVSGGSVSESERVLVGQATQVGAALFEGFDYVALGHLHRPQRITDRVHYSGSPLPYSFSEAEDQKSLLSVELAHGEPPRVVRIPVALPRRMKVLRGGMKRLLEDPALGIHAEDYVRAEITDASAGISPFTLLRTRFPYLLSLEVVREGTSPGLPGPSAPRTAERVDPEDDFRAFAQVLHGAEGPSPAALTSFRSIQQSLEGGSRR